MTPEELTKYGTKNVLPENVIFKLLERYYYLRFMRELKILIDDNKIDTEEDMQHIIIQLGATRKAIEISPVQGTVRQTEVSMPFANKLAQKAECIVL